MIEEYARVVELDGDDMVLQADVKTSCQSCSASKGCGTSLLARHVARKMTHFRVPNTLNAVVGDEVVVGLSETALLRGSLLVYLWPLLCMIALALLADYLLAVDIAARDLRIASAAMLGLACGVLLVRSGIAGCRSQQQLTPVVLRKQHGDRRIY
jgi:sigma-E factor negative regulatory protein RseC